MGIQGLLPALKSIQTTKHLSEFSGQTVAVDGYVWLHKGIFTCATELATGKPTHKYVNYAMEKVRLLRHHGVEPYLVFDGGPLPAKKGTEVERKRKRQDQLARGNLLASQGKHVQARDCYLKSIDVTPQMAFQLIKALRAESVKYVVAPYEADAQLTYLEQQGIVSAILTEDSDLLVFGCQNVLLKFDPVARTVVSIRRADFASVTATSSDSNGISLVGWSDTQFRAMAILSGCDYLPSIPGIGLKTANAMLRKWKTPQAVVRQVGLEGKKRVPKGYLDQYKLAEKCFLHQRVYDLSTERLVYLTDVDLQDWDDVAEAYIGGDLDPALAKQIAMGDADPITFEPMVDINPQFCPRPRVLQDLPNGMRSVKGKGKEKSKSKSKPSGGGILNFFGPNPTIPPRPKSPPLKLMTVGKASGKRTLAEVMDQDIAAKKKRRSPSSAPTSPNVTSSKFFGGSVRRASSGAKLGLQAGFSSPRTEKENAIDAEEEVDDGDSLLARGYVDSEMEHDIQSDYNPVEQEDGYISPTPSMSKDVDDLSSPVRPGPARSYQDIPQDDYDFEVDPISSPPRADPSEHPQHPSSQHARANPLPKVLVEASPEVISRKQVVTKNEPSIKLDLRYSFGDEPSSEIDCDDVDSSPLSPSPLTPNELVQRDLDRTLDRIVPWDDLELEDPEEKELMASASRTKIVAAGWRNRWALDSSRTTASVGRNASFTLLQRRETNVTPEGRHRISRLSSSPLVVNSRVASSSKSAPRSVFQSIANPSKGRKSLTFFGEAVNNVEGSTESQVHIGAGPEVHPELLPETRLRLERFRCQ